MFAICGENTPCMILSAIRIGGDQESTDVLDTRAWESLAPTEIRPASIHGGDFTPPSSAPKTGLAIGRMLDTPPGSYFGNRRRSANSVSRARTPTASIRTAITVCAPLGAAAKFRKPAPYAVNSLCGCRGFGARVLGKSWAAHPPETCVRDRLAGVWKTSDAEKCTPGDPTLRDAQYRAEGE